MFRSKNYVAALVLIFCFVDCLNCASLSKQELKNYKNLIEGQGLYSVDDDVTIITAQNFKKQIYGNTYAVIVEFYNSWCGFCQRFAPSWKALASDVKSWKSMINIAAVDCSDDDNSPICRDFEIMSYPTLRYFHENYEEGTGKIGVDVRKGDDVNSHKAQLIAQIINEQRQNRGQIFPNILPYTDSDYSHLFDDLPIDAKYVFLIIQPANSILGPEIALDLREVPHVYVKYALSNNTDLIASGGADKLPAMLAVAQDKSVHVFIANLETREGIHSVIKDYLKPNMINIPEVTTKKNIYTGKWLDVEVPDMSELMAAREKEALKRKIKQMGDVVFQADLESALRYSLKHEVGLTKTISGKKLSALNKYLNVLVKYFPFGLQGQNFLKDLKDSVSNSDSISGESITRQVIEAEQDGKEVFSSSVQWLACSGSSTTTRGYPCGLWKLFHYLTVNAAEQGEDEENKNSKEVLDAMYGYIKNFFGCADCSRHFQEMAEEKDMNSVSSLDSAVLWLWMAHNTVNKRLSGDVTEDPEFPKVQFPLTTRCASCKNSDNTWNLPEVLQYLKHVYSNINLRYIGSDTRILHKGLEGPNGSNGSSAIFKSIDESMCIILFVGSFCLIVLLIRLFLKRGYKKKMYVHDLLGKV